MARKPANTRAIAKLMEAMAIIKRNYRANAAESNRFVAELMNVISRNKPFHVIYDGAEFEINPQRILIHKTRVDFGTMPALSLHLGLVGQGDEEGEYMTWDDSEDGLGRRVTLFLKEDAERVPSKNLEYAQ